MKGFVIVPNEWILSSLDDGAFRLLCLLGRYALEDGTCHLGTAELAGILKLTEREIRYRLRTLETAGMVRREYRDKARHHLGGIVVPGAKVIGKGPPATPADGTPVPSVDGTPVPSRRNKHSVKTPPDGTPVPSVDGTNIPSPLNTEDAGAGASDSEERFNPERESRREPACPHEDTTVTDSHGEPIDLDCGERPDPAELKRLALWADEKFGSVYWGSQVRAYAKTYPFDWIRMVVEDAGTWVPPPFNFQPLLNKLRLWARNGGPPSTATVPFARPAAPAKQKNRTEQLLEELDRRIAAQEAT